LSSIGWADYTALSANCEVQPFPAPRCLEKVLHLRRFYV
jgi:hypothetical protein